MGAYITLSIDREKQLAKRKRKKQINTKNAFRKKGWKENTKN